MADDSMTRTRTLRTLLRKGFAFVRFVRLHTCQRTFANFVRFVRLVRPIEGEHGQKPPRHPPQRRAQFESAVCEKAGPATPLDRSLAETASAEASAIIQ